MRVPSLAFAWLAFFCCLALPSSLAAQTPGPFSAIEDLLQKEQYDQALAELTKPLPSDRDYAEWLKALANAKLGRLPAARALCDSFKKTYPSSPWFHKVNFLLADILSREKNYQAAETIYAEEAARLLSEGRKKANAEIYVKLAENLAYQPKPDELDRPAPNYALAYRYYNEALQLEAGPELSDTVRYQMARIMEKAKNYPKALEDYRNYLASDARTSRHITEVRLRLAETLLKVGDLSQARIQLEDLITSLKADSRPEAKNALRLAMRRLPATYRVPSPSSDFELEGGLKTIDEFLAAYPSDPVACRLAWDKTQALASRGRTDAAIQALKDLIAKKTFRLATETADDRQEREDIGVFLSPEEQYALYGKEALAQIGRLHFGQGNYPAAIQAYADYISQFPNGPFWTSAQQGIIDAEYQQGVDQAAKNHYAEAEKLWTKFLVNHPLDARARKIVFTLAQMQYRTGADLKATDKEKSLAGFRAAVTAFKKLVSLYPGTEEASLAQLRIGEIQEKDLGDWEGALASYRQLTWGSQASEAADRVSRMITKELVVRTARTFRTNEKALVNVQVRNIDKLTVRAYKLNLEAYFRKFHGVGGVENLDLALIQPDKTWEAVVAGYAKYLPIEQDIEIPMTGPGVYAVSVSSPELESTTLVIRSDVELVLKSSRQEVLVFAQDMRQNLALGNARVLIADDQTVLSEGKTGKDGVLLQRLPALASGSNLHAFVEWQGNVAATGLSLNGLSVSTGLAPKGYIYTDRPAYKPGETVQIKGILRDAVGGSFAIPKAAKFTCLVTDPSGKTIYRDDRALNEFGTLGLAVALSSRSAQGAYSIVFSSKEWARSFTGSFTVEDFHLEKIQLTWDFDRPFYFRGEKISARLGAKYYFGRPVGHHDVRYTTPDGLVHEGKTDADGQLTVDFDTSTFSPGQVLSFSGVLSGENVRASKQISLAVQEFTVQLSSPKTVALAGTPTELTLLTRDVTGKPVPQTVEVSLFRRVTQQTDALVASVPWLNEGGPVTYSEVLVDKKSSTTDQNGTARVSFSPETGGTYLVRAKAKDRLGNVITSEYGFFVSDDNDETLLHFLTNRETYPVGSSDTLVLHSRVKKPTLALICFEGESILKYSIISLEKRETPITFQVGNESFPNFVVSAACMSQNQLQEATAAFTVERQLTITVKPLKAVSKPGERTKVEVTVVDQLGRPVAAEFSLSLVNQSLLALYQDPAAPIVSFFQDGTRRTSPMALATSAAFSYRPETRDVNPELAVEKERLATAKPAKGLSAGAAQNAPMVELSGKTAQESGELDLGIDGAGQSPIDAPDEALADGFATLSEQTKKSDDSRSAPRKDFDTAGFWAASVTTDQTGKAVVEIAMPDQSTAYRILVKGVSKESLVGQAEAEVISRKDFFASLKTPSVMQEKDLVRLVGQIHNNTAYQGPVTARLTILADKVAKALPDQTLTIGPNETQTVVFGAYPVPAATTMRLVLEVTAGKSYQDNLAVDLPVRPWGLPVGVRKSGTAKDSVTLFAELPNKTYQSSWMTVAIRPPVNQALVDLVLNRTSEPLPFWSQVPFGAGPESRLHALVVLSGYLAGKNTAPGVAAEVRSQILAAITDLVAAQQSGGWTSSENGEAAMVSSQAYWALKMAVQAGFAVDDTVLRQARDTLRNQFTALPQDDNETKAVIQYALSFGGDADSSFVNRLYRSRNELSEAALLFTALTLGNLGKKEAGQEMLTLAASRSEAVAIDTGLPSPKPGRRWTGSSNHPWLANPIEATALAVMAYEALAPQDAALAQGLAYLQSVVSPGSEPAKAIGYVTQALAQFYASAPQVAADGTVQVSVNDRVAGQIRVRPAGDTVESQLVEIPRDFLKTGANKVQLSYTGKGEYQYAVDLTGFTTDLTDPESWNLPSFEAKKIIHEPLRYQGRELGASTTEIAQLESTQTADVEIVFHGGSRQDYTVLEDSLPAGAVLLKETLSGSYSSVQIEGSRVLFYFQPDLPLSTIRYTIAWYAPGRYQMLPPVLREVFQPSQMRLGRAASLELLAPGEKSAAAYAMNNEELFALGSATFDDGDYKASLDALEKLFARAPQAHQPDLARMLLWIRTEPEFFDGKKVVDAFEILKEKYPELSIPFSKILVVGKAYHDIGEFERANLVYKAAVDASFMKDSVVGGQLEGAGKIADSIGYMTKLWGEYHDSAAVSTAWYSLAQAVYSYVPIADKLGGRKFTPTELLDLSSSMLWRFATLYPDHAFADDAAFTRLNIAMDKKDFANAVRWSQTYEKTYAESPFQSNFQYMEALGQFSQRHYQEAIQAARKVAAGTSENNDLSTYMLGQIYHSQRKPAEALAYYETVKDQFPDAQEAIDYFEKKTVAMDEVTVRLPGQKVDLTLRYRNIKDLNLQVYKVDLMTLYLREKNLSKITQINLSGIAPSIEKTLVLGGKEYTNKEQTVPLELKDEGAYLVVCRGDDLFTSGLVLITPLALDVQEDANSGRVRVNVFDQVRKVYPDNVHVKVVGSQTARVVSGETDLRGIFIADAITGVTTVIARDQSNRYAFYRGAQWLGSDNEETVYDVEPDAPTDTKPQYRENDFRMMEKLQEDNRVNLDNLYKQKVDGVQVQQAR